MWRQTLVSTLRGGSDDNQIKNTRGLQMSNETKEILVKFETCTSVDDVFRLAEEIPAIRRSPDKMARIAWAKEEDAILAANAIQRLATIFSHPQYVHPMQPFTLERRFEVCD